MFKFLKNKIQDAVKKFSKNTKTQEEEVEVEVPIQETPQPIQEPVEEPIQEQVIEQPADVAQGEVVPKKEEVIPKKIVQEEVPQKTVEELKPVIDSKKKILVEQSIKEKSIEEKPSIKKSSSKKEVSDDAPQIIEMVEPESKPELESKEVVEDVSIPLEVEEFIEPTSDSISQQTSDKVAELFESEDEPSISEPIEETISEEQSIVDDVKLETIEESLEDDLEKTDIEPVALVGEEVQEEKKPGFFKRVFGKKETAVTQPISEKEDLGEELADEVIADIGVEGAEQSRQVNTGVDVKKAPATDLLDEISEDATKKKKGFFRKLKEKIVKFQLTEEKFEEIFWDFELALMENNVALEVIEKVKKDMHDQLTKENISRKSVDEVILETLKNSLDDVLTVESFDFIERIKTTKPYVISMIGVNGSGKTTTLAKLIHLLQKNNLSVVVAASDTFRAAAIQQLEEHTTKLGVKLIKHDYNADPSAVAYDAIAHAKAKDIDVVLIDTAGRLQSNNNLMDELKKLIRVNKPDLNIFIGESVTGNDCVEQAMAFNDAVGIDGIILSKADIDEKGGAAISVSYVTKKPILYIGTGQTYDDLKPFKKDEILANLGL